MQKACGSTLSYQGISQDSLPPTVLIFIEPQFVPPGGWWSPY